MNQAGVYKLTLYDALDTTYTRVSKTEVAEISGTSIVIDQCNNPSFSAPAIKVNRKLKFQNSFTFTLFGLDNSVLSQLDNKFGWLVLITFQNGSEYFLTTPSFKIGTSLDVNNTQVYPITLQPNLPTERTMLFDANYVPPAPSFIGVRNGGYIDTTDWLNAISGVAQYWIGGDIYDTHSIVTGNGFTGNAQRIELITTSPSASGAIVSSDTYNLTGLNITVSIKYRMSIDTTVFIRNWSDNQVISFINTEQLTAVEHIFDVTLTNAGFRIGFDMVGTKIAGNFYEIDEVKYKVNS